MHDRFPCRGFPEHVVVKRTVAGRDAGSAIAIQRFVHAFELRDDVFLQTMVSRFVGEAQICGVEVGAQLAAGRFLEPELAAHVPVADFIGDVMHRCQRRNAGHTDGHRKYDPNGECCQQLFEHRHAIEPLHGCPLIRFRFMWLTARESLDASAPSLTQSPPPEVGVQRI
ncbi:hypothetical protein VSR83_36260 [Paraburkholderia unamae]|uniref:Uncharacterized protein n=1 Tax=Paraburkholderia unamae TaxID=219649 RepID=A0ACC6RV48_9BURK